MRFGGDDGYRQFDKLQESKLILALATVLLFVDWLLSKLRRNAR